MRDAFVEALVEVARTDPRIVLVTADLGFGVLDPFVRAFPDRFVNVGVAEQNMTGVAAGLAAEGHVVFTYSIGNFATMRCLEQIRNDVCYHNLDVKIVAVGGGFSYGALGITHHATEDLAIMRALPNMTVIAPNDAAEARELTRQLADLPGPAYLRLARSSPETLASPDESGPHDIRIGLARVLRSGNSMLILATGGLAEEALHARELLSGHGLDAAVSSIHTIKPLDTHLVQQAAAAGRTLVTLEEHSEIGGLGSAVADFLSAGAVERVRLIRLAVPDRFSPTTGSQAYLRRHAALDGESIAVRLLNVFDRSSASFAHPNR